jgi:tetratricopeptide (TPR) repeat protein
MPLPLPLADERTSLETHVVSASHPDLRHEARGRQFSPGMRAFCLCLLALCLCLLAFWPTLSASLVARDDGQYVIYGQASNWAMARYFALTAFGRFHIPSDTGGYYQPITSVSFLIDAAVMKDPETAAFYHHFVNVILHLLNVLLVFVLARKLSRSIVWPLLLALLFGLHPVQTESVAWIAQRMTLLATFFSLLTIAAYLRYVERHGLSALFAITICYALAVLSKPTFIGLPVVLLALDVWPLRRRRHAGRGRDSPDGAEPAIGQWVPLIEKTPLFTLMVACGVAIIWTQHHVQPAAHVEAAGFDVIARNFVSWAGRIFWPIGLSPFRPLSLQPADAWWLILSGVPIIVLIAAVFVVTFRFSKPLFVALAGSLILVAPSLINIPFSRQLLSDAHLYPALIMPILVFAAWVRDRADLLQAAPGRIGALGLGALACVCGVQANLQTHIWRDSTTLYKEAIRQHPEWVPGYLGLVQAYIRAADLDSALFYAEKAAAKAPNDPQTRFYLGRVLLRHESGRSRESIEHLRAALVSDPDWIDCLHDLGVALAENDEVEEAIPYLERARDLRPNSGAIHMALGNAYMRVDRPASARREFQLSLNARNNARAHLGLARAWAANERLDYAKRHLARALEMNPDLAEPAAAYPELSVLHDDPDVGPLLRPRPGPDAVLDATRQRLPSAIGQTT